MSARVQLDDLMDARAEIRDLTKLVASTKAAYDQARSDLAKKRSLAEEILVQIEQRQGRLPFDPEAAKSPRKGRKRPGAQGGSLDEKEGAA
jgi:hypothetical protein